MSKQNIAIAVLFIISAVSAQAGSKINISNSDPVDINNQTVPVPITEINRITSDVTTPSSKTTTSGPNVTTATTTTPKPTESPTTTTTAATTTKTPLTTIAPVTSTTAKPNVTTVPTGKPTGTPPTTPVPSHRRFDGPSFIGGIVLALGLVAIGFVAFKFYKARTELNYHTL